MRGKRAEAEVVARDGRPPRAHVEREQHEHDGDAGESSARSARAMAAERPHAVTSRRPRAGRSSARCRRAGATSSAPSSEQRPRLRRGDRCGMPLRGVREDARVDERVRRRRAPRRGAGRAAPAKSGTMRTGMCSRAERERLLLEQRLVGIRVVEVADEQDRAVLHVRALQRAGAPSSGPCRRACRP